MLDLALPKIDVERAADSYARFRIEPLEPGYGYTMGNALRRVLLSSIPGAAVTRIKIDGVYHEFATVAGVREDVTEIVLNVKGIRLRSYAERPVKLHLSKTGPGIARASDIDAPSNVEIVNPQHYIASLDGEDAQLDIELTVERHRGYSAGRKPRPGADRRNSGRCDLYPDSTGQLCRRAYTYWWYDRLRPFDPGNLDGWHDQAR